MFANTTDLTRPPVNVDKVDSITITPRGDANIKKVIPFSDNQPAQVRYQPITNPTKKNNYNPKIMPQPIDVKDDVSISGDSSRLMLVNRSHDFRNNDSKLSRKSTRIHPGSVWRKVYDQNLLYQLDKSFKIDDHQDAHFDQLGKWKKNDIKGLRKSKFTFITVSEF